MNSMWNSTDFKKELVSSAKSIIEQQCIELSKITNKKVVGVLRSYDGKYKSGKYLSSGYLTATQQALSQFGKTGTEYFNVQKVLGNQGEGSKFVYEFYLTAKATPNYKYRVFLLYFDSRLYPVGLAIEQSVADEIKCETEIEVPDEETFKNLLASILSSNTVTSVIKNLLSFYELPGMDYSNGDEKIQ